jgi:outer membrane immunogenic protein
MHRQIAVALLSGSLVGLASAASAADMPVPKALPPPPPVYNWTGCYVAAGGGYGMFNQNRDLVSEFINASAGTAVAYANGAPPGTVLVANETFGGRGWLATAQLGCDVQVGGNWVIGAFVDGDWSNIRGDQDLVTGLNGEAKLRWSWAVGGRIGWLVTPNLLTFFSGGYTEASFHEVDYFGTLSAVALGTGLAIAVPGTGPSGLQLASQRYRGYFLGSGAEYAIGWLPGLFWKSEYRFADYRSETTSINCVNTALCGAPGPTGIGARIHPYVHTVRSELVWRFNWAPAPVRAAY